MDNKRGISIVSLIITIIVIIILASVAVYYGVNQNLQQAVFTRVYTEISEVNDAVAHRGLAYEMNHQLYPYVGEPLTDAVPIEIAGQQYGEGYYYVHTDEHKKDLNLDNVLGSYVVNYNTGETISIDAILYGDKEYHTIDDISKVVAGEDVVSEAEYNEEKGVNRPIVEDGMIPVIDRGSGWEVTTEDDPEWYDYSSDAKKWANIMLMDEIEVEGYTNVEIREMTKSERQALAGTKVTTMGSMFVWIPRYTYKVIDGGEVNVVYSNLLKDYTEEDYIRHPAFYFGGYIGGTDTNPNSGYRTGGTELTGLWLSKYEAGFAE